MTSVRPAFVMTLVAACAIAWPTRLDAAEPRNPYSSFNLSGINYGAQQWERAQRQGKVVWPYYNVPGRVSSQRTSRGPGISVGGVFTGGGGAGAIVHGGSYRQAPRSSATGSGRRSRR